MNHEKQTRSSFGIKLKMGMTFGQRMEFVDLQDVFYA